MTLWSSSQLAPELVSTVEGRGRLDPLTQAKVTLAFADTGLRISGGLLLLYTAVRDVIVLQGSGVLMVKWGLWGLVLVFLSMYRRAWGARHAAELVAAADLAIQSTVTELEQKLMQRNQQRQMPN
jgi:uncharacterized membrane protein